MKRRPTRLYQQNQTLCLSAERAGFSLVEVLVGLLIFSLVVAASFATFSLATGGTFRTGRLANANAAIDSDIAKIKKLSEDYSACVDPLGSILPDCRDSTNAIIPAGSSWYYQPGTSANFESFYAACNAPSESAHITKNLITAINALTRNVGSGVTRSLAQREAPAVANNHIIVISYQAADFSLNRTIKITPVLSSWCP